MIFGESLKNYNTPLMLFSLVVSWIEEEGKALNKECKRSSFICSFN
jgi:hypothetical protein